MSGTLFSSRPRTAPARKPYRLLLEPLEDRLTPAGPVIYHVTGTADAALAPGQVTPSGANFNATTLRAAINAANTDLHTGTDTIQLHASGTAYQVTFSGGGQLRITASETIQGDGASVTVIDGGGTGKNAVADSDFAVSGSAGDVAFNGVTIEGGHTSGDGGGIDNFGGRVTVNNCVVTNNVADGSGGGISNRSGATLTVNTSVISGNTASREGGGIFNSASGANPLQVFNSTISGNTVNFFGDGGGLSNVAPGQVTVSGSTFSNNTAHRGGAISNASNSHLSLVNDTITNNHAGGEGGGINQAGFGSGSTSLLNVTLFHNTAAAGKGGNIFVDRSGTVTLENTIVAGSFGSGDNFAGPGTITSLGHNLEDHNDLSPSGPGDLHNTNPGLDPNGLQNNGGPTQTIALLPGSAAIDAANTADAPSTDQRGVPRPQGPAADIGAFEVVVPPPPSTTPAPASADLAVSMNFFPPLTAQARRHGSKKRFTFQITITNNGPGTAFGALYLNQLPKGLDFVTVVTSQGTFLVAGKFLGVFLGNVPPGASVQIFLTVDAKQAGSFVNKGQVFSQTPDPNPLNNFASLGFTTGIPLFESDNLLLFP
jgi:uncharacterized repeat protein (TIGR01451 family)